MNARNQPFLIHDSEAVHASNAAAARLELRDAIDERMNKALAIIDLVGAAKTSNLADDTLATACWTVRGLMSEMTELLGKVGI